MFLKRFAFPARRQLLTCLYLQILNNDAELAGWKANKVGDDYKFTRLSSDEDLRLFIEEHSLEPEGIQLVSYLSINIVCFKQIKNIITLLKK